jgi:hypothetical protein
MSDSTDISQLADDLSNALEDYTRRKVGGHRGDVEMVRDIITGLEHLLETLHAAWDEELHRKGNA